MGYYINSDKAWVLTNRSACRILSILIKLSIEFDLLNASDRLFHNLGTHALSPLVDTRFQSKLRARKGEEV